MLDVGLERKLEQILVFGIGNLVMSDDGFGSHAIRELEQSEEPLPENVTLVDAGTSIIDQMPDLVKAKHLVCIDVVEGGGEPGTIYRFRPEDITYKKSKFHHAHKIDIFATLEMVEQMEGHKPDTVIIGVQPKNIDWGTELTPELAEKMPEVLGIVRDEIDKINTGTQN